MHTFVQKPEANKQVTTPARAYPKRRPASIPIPNSVARNHACGFDLSGVPVNAPATTGNQNSLARSARLEANRLAAQTDTHADSPISASSLGSRLPQAHGTAVEAASLLSGSSVADEKKANAVTLGQTVHLSSAFPRLPPAEQQRVLAHEAVHVAQNLTPGPSASRPALEMEAHRLGSQVIAGHRVQPQLHADAAMALAEDGGPMPNDHIAVRKAKARREVLLRWKAVYEGSKDKNLIAEHQKIRNKRIALDDSMRKTLAKLKKFEGYAREVEEYHREEKANIAKLNKKPVTLEVTETDIRLKVRFNVRFEGANDKQAKERFPVLRRNLEQGIRDTWNHKLKGTLLPGRALEVIPEINLVPHDAARNHDFWLVTVRPADKSPMVYDGAELPAVQRPTSVASAQLDGGVMTIPPSHVHLPAILGHETLHLFGLADRYVELPDDGIFSLRETEGRSDPLGVHRKKDELTGKEEDIKYPLPSGKILEEDLGFVLDQFGIYPGIPYSDVLLELRAVDKIISTERDPDSLIRKRTNFNDKIDEQARNIE